MNNAVCRVCGAPEVQIFYQQKRVPVHQNLPLSSCEAAQSCKRGDIQLAFCPMCGFVSNLAFDPDLLNYSPQYENSQSFSPGFYAYMETLAHDLVNRYSLKNKHIIEIGSGKGEFLEMLCAIGENQGIGFDPSYVETSHTTTRMTFIRDFFSERYAHHNGDLICSRHVLEHVQYPAEMLKSVRRSIGERLGTVVFLEIPSVTWVLQNVTFWDIFYEHCSYFSSSSVARLFAACGFRVMDVRQAFGGQYLHIEAFPSAYGGRADTEVLNFSDTAQDIVYFTTHYQQKVEGLRHMIKQVEEKAQRCIIWGAGAKGVTFLNVMDIQPAVIPYVVDINPRKQGLYVPGTGQQIVAPSFIKSYVPDVIFVMNPNYLDEISQTVASLGVASKLVSL